MLAEEAKERCRSEKASNLTVAVVLLNKLSGGIDRMISNLLKTWDPNEIDSLVFCRDGRLLCDSFELRMKWRFFKVASPLRGLALRTELALWCALRKSVFSHPGIVLNPHDRVSLAYCTMLRMLYPRRCRLVPTVHQLSSSLSTSFFRQVVFRAIELLGFRIADRIITVCEARKREVLGYGVPHAKVFTVYNGPDVSSSSPSVTRDEARFRLGLPPSVFIAAFVGRLSPEKGISDLLHEMQNQRRSLQNVLLVVAGEGPLEADLKAFVARCNLHAQVRLIGHVEDVSLVYQAADALVAPSRDEGLSMTILEAMSFGRPVIATAVGGNPELVDDSVGALVPPDDMPALFSALAKLATNSEDHERKGANARQRVDQRFSSSSMAAETIRCLSSAERR